MLEVTELQYVNNLDQSSLYFLNSERLLVFKATMNFNDKPMCIILKFGSCFFAHFSTNYSMVYNFFDEIFAPITTI